MRELPLEVGHEHVCQVVGEAPANHDPQRRQIRPVLGECWDNRQSELQRHSGSQWVVAPVAGTTNETLVNGQAITAPRALRHGDLIAVGRQAKGIVKMPLTARAR